MGGCRVRVHEDAKPRLDTLVRRIPALTEKRLHCACARDAIEPLCRMLLDDGAVRSDNGKNRPAAAVRRWAEKGRPHRARAQRALNDLILLRDRDDVAVCYAAHVHTDDHGAWGSF